jgi:ABC-type sugar transport system permease subunit
MKEATLHPADPRTALYLRLAAVWHVVLILIGLGGIFWAVQAGTDQLANWLKIMVIVLLMALIIASGAAFLFIQRREHRGRVISLVINYLGLLFCLLAGMQVLQIFVGIDSLADTFGRGVPYLIGMFAGYLISALGDRYEGFPERQAFFQRIGKYVALLAFIAFLFAIGLLQGLLALLTRLAAPLPLALMAGLVLFAIAIWAMWRQPSALAMQANNSHEEMLSGFLFLSPNLLGFICFFAGPLIFSFFVSFTNWDAFGTRDWVGLSNYAKIFNLTIQPLEARDTPVTEALNVEVYDEVARFGLFGKYFIFGAEDKLFWLALRNTFVFCLLAVPLSIIPALFLANLLNSKLPGMKFFRAVYFLPSIAAVVGVALIWQWLYNAAVGYINYGITSSVELINALLGGAVIDPQIRWLSDTRTALLAVVIMSAWQWLGFNTVLFLAGLQNIPNELYEAATVDGAGNWNKFWNVTVPLLAPTTFFVVTTTVIQALQLFEQVYVLIPTEPPGGPNNSTLTLVLYLYQKGFQRFEQGYASAVAWVLFAVIFTVTLIQYRRSRSSSAYAG